MTGDHRHFPSHPHHHDAPRPSDPELRVRALESRLVGKELVEPLPHGEPIVLDALARDGA